MSVCCACKNNVALTVPSFAQPIHDGTIHLCGQMRYRVLYTSHEIVASTSHISFMLSSSVRTLLYFFPQNFGSVDNLFVRTSVTIFYRIQHSLQSLPAKSRRVAPPDRPLIWRPGRSTDVVALRNSLNFFGLEDRWRTFLRALAQISNNFRVNSSSWWKPACTDTRDVWAPVIGRRTEYVPSWNPPPPH
jgi:hypothetical protein